MIARQPYLPRFMAGGPGNPLGARALYLGATVYRIHGTNRPDTIGTAVSSGCFRLVNAELRQIQFLREKGILPYKIDSTSGQLLTSNHISNLKSKYRETRLPSHSYFKWRS